MEYTVKIIQEYKLENLWKYKFLDAQTNQVDYFYHSEPIDYNPNSVGKLTLTVDKCFRSFEQEINNVVEGFDKANSLVRVEGWLGKTIENTVNKFFDKKIKLSLDVQHLHRLHQMGYTWKQVAIMYERHEQSIYRWIRPNVKPPQKRGVKLKVSDEVLNLFNTHFLQNNTATQQERVDYIYQKTGIKLHRSTVSRLLKRLGITRKKLTYHYNQLDEEKAKAFNEEIKPLLKEYVFMALDECSFYPNQDPRFGYSLKGERAKSKKPSYKGKHYTLLFAISSLGKNGVVKWKLTDKKVNWKVFYDFLEEINSIGDKKNILLMDNSRVHTAFNKRAEKVLPSVEEQMMKKNIEVRFITTYAPMLNPTELVFNLLRQQTEKQRPRNYEEMELAVKKVVELLNKKDLMKYFKHCANYFDRKDTKIKLKKTII